MTHSPCPPTHAASLARNTSVTHLLLHSRSWAGVLICKLCIRPIIGKKAQKRPCVDRRLTQICCFGWTATSLIPVAQAYLIVDNGDSIEVRPCLLTNRLPSY